MRAIFSLLPSGLIGGFLITATMTTNADGHLAHEKADLAQDLKTAEAMIDAFYSFEPTQLEPFLTDAVEASPRIMYYQGWAEGGNYKVLSRAPCAETEDHKIACPITVQDDPVLALKTGFNVTDTFTLTFADKKIINVETSSNDQPIYYEARKWVQANKPDIMNGPCKGQSDKTGSAQDCARAMTRGYAEFYKTQYGTDK